MKKSQNIEEIFAEIQLSLPNKINSIKKRFSNIHEITDNLKRFTFIRKLPNNDKESQLFSQKEINVLGFSPRINTLSAFGGILYSINITGCNLLIENKKILEQNTYSSFEMGDVNFTNHKEVILWKQYCKIFELIENAIRENDQINLIILDIPLMIRRVQQLALRSKQIIQEYEKTQEFLDIFWRNNLNKFYPYDSNGIIICSLYRSFSSNFINALNNKKLSNSSEPISEELIEYIFRNLDVIERVGFSRILYNLMKPNYRSLSYSFSDLKYDVRTEPRFLLQELNGLYLKLNSEGSIFNLEFLGKKNQWNSDLIDDMTSKIVELTWMNTSDSLPIPLWYARNLTKDAMNFLKFFKKSIRNEFKLINYRR